MKHWLLLACWVASPSYAAITFRGAAISPADNTAAGTTASRTITPVASMVSGDLIDLCAYVNGTNHDSTDDYTITAAGGQSWAAFSRHLISDRGAVKCWSATFNGTWSGSLTVEHSDNPTGNFAFSLVMKVAIPTSGSNIWTVDVAEAATSYAAPGGSCDVARTGQTSIAANTITFADFFSADDNTWVLQTGGWTNPGGVAMWRNTYGSADASISSAYKIQTSAAATGSVTNRQTASGCDGGWTRIVTYAESSSAPSACSGDPPAGKQRLNCPTGYTSIAGGSVIEAFNLKVSPDIAIGDIAICDLVTTPSGYALTMGADGNFSYDAHGDQSRQSWNCEFYDVSAAGTHASELDAYNNNLAPYAVGEPESVKFFVPEDLPMDPEDLTGLCGDGEGDALIYTAVDALPAGLSIVDNVLQGTATTAGRTVVTFRCTDVAEESTDFD